MSYEFHVHREVVPTMSINNIENTMELFKNYPYMEELIKDHKLENLLHRMKWHMFEENQIAAQFQDILQTYEDLTSSDITRIHEGRSQALQDYLTIGNELHVFSKEQAHHELSLTSDDVERIFAKVELGGAKYCSPEDPQQL